MAEKLYRDDRVWRTLSRTLVGNNEGHIMIQKLMDIYETIMSELVGEDNSLLCNKCRCRFIFRRRDLSEGYK